MFKFNKIMQVFMEEEPGAGGGGDPAPSGDPTPAPSGDPTPSGDPAPAPAGEIQPFYNALPDTWRNEMVDSLGLEDDTVKDKRLGQLNRVPDFKTLVKNHFEAQDKIRAGFKSEGLPENPSAEQLTEYRESHDIPATAGDYNYQLEDGLVFGEADERIMSEVNKVAHELNIPNTTVGTLANVMMNARAVEEQAIVQQDGVDTQNTNRILQDNWGSDYETNKNMISGLANLLPEEVKNDFLNARMPGGQALFNSPEFVVFMADMARKINPAGTVVPNSNNPTQAITDEIKKLEGMMGDDSWHKDTASQQRLQKLYEAQEGMTQ